MAVSGKLFVRVQLKSVRFVAMHFGKKQTSLFLKLKQYLENELLLKVGKIIQEKFMKVHN